MTSEETHIPSYIDLMRPMLEALESLGREATNDEVDVATIEASGLTDEQVAIEFGPSQTQQGSKVLHRTAWARTYLKKGGLIANPSRGRWALLDEGREVLRLGPEEADRFLAAMDRDIRRQPDDLGDTQIRRAADPAYAATYDAARRWRDTSLLTGASFFEGQRMVWIPDVVADLHHRLIENADFSARSFGEKLDEQLNGASQEVRLLAAEILYVHLLPLSNVSGDRKLAIINEVGEHAPEGFGVPADLEEALGLGPVNGGVGFNTNRYYLVEYLIEFAARWTELPEADRIRLLADPWAFKALLLQIPDKRAGAQRNALLFLLFPETFEDIASSEHKKRIVQRFSDVSGESPDIDRQLLQARDALAGEFGSDFSWYWKEVRRLWDEPLAKQANQTDHTTLIEDVEHVFPIADERRAFLELTARAIEIAHEVNPRSWSATRAGRGFSVNVGPNRALKGASDEIGFMVAGTEADLVRAMDKAGVTTMPSPYQFPADAFYVRFDSPADFTSAAAALSEAIEIAVQESARRNTPYLKSFSEEVCVYIEEELGIGLPRPTIPKGGADGSAWMVRVKRDDGSGVAESLQSGQIRVFWDLDIPAGSSIDDVREAVRQADPERSNHYVGNQAGSLHRFITRMQAGDLVVMPDKSGLYFGVVLGDAFFLPEEREWARQVAWANADAPTDRSDVSSALYSKARTLLTVTELSELADEIRMFVEADETEAVVPAQVRLQPIDSDTAESWMLDRQWLQEIVDMLTSKKQVIFYGPPGTGKTYLATKLADHLTADGGAYQLVQFHPSYSYEDLVEGFRPKVVDGAMAYELTPGPLKNLAEEARRNPNEPHFLIIDEINRGNLAKIFGELYYLLEYRDHSLTLQYGNATDEGFALPKNLFVIGTMNTADRSIALVDAAIRRRFYFVEFSPNEEPIAGLLRRWLKRQRIDETPALILDELNRRLSQDKDLAIGPSYLMTENIGEQRELERIWKHAIMPLLTEYFYGQPANASQFELKVLQRAILKADSNPLTGVEVEASDGEFGAEPH